MTTEFRRRLDTLDNAESHQHLSSIRRGVEKEGLRINSSGSLATTAHPAGLGSPLTNSSITTDFSEALLELVTKPHSDIESAAQELAELHQFTYRQLDEEVIWASSMPCVVPDDDAIPIANYGNSNVGQMKRVYRIGLGHRYGRAMQTIAGIHYNFSLPEEFWNNDNLCGDYGCDESARPSVGYMALTRNFHRYCWLLMYLFGASPAVCKSFLNVENHKLETLSPGTLYLPYATSLRMSDIGYQNSAQDNIYIDLNSVQAYAASLIDATNTVYPAYQQSGVKVDGQYRQLNANLLQIENEYYAVIRPKRIANSGEKPSRALIERGVEYVEARCFDIDPFETTGISQQTMRFIDAFCLYCLIDQSPPIDNEAHSRINRNRLNVVRDGRRPGFELELDDNKKTGLAEAASELLGRVAAVGELLDQCAGNDEVTKSIKTQFDKVEDSSKTPSARVLAEITERQESFFEFGNRISYEHAKELKARAISRQTLARLTKQAEDSRVEQNSIEANDEIDFDTYLQRYFES